MKLLNRCIPRLRLLPVCHNSTASTSVEAERSYRYALAAATKSRYVLREWTDEQFDDVVHLALTKCPKLKPYFLELLATKFNDDAAFSKWRKSSGRDGYNR